MPTRSLTSSVIKWPDAATVIEAFERWARETMRRPEVLNIGYFGSYAHGSHGVGSDLDVVIIIEQTSTPFIRRSAEWDLTGLPVPTDVLIYTQSEWEKLDRNIRFHRMLLDEAIWVCERRGCEE